MLCRAFVICTPRQEAPDCSKGAQFGQLSIVASGRQGTHLRPSSGLWVREQVQARVQAAWAGAAAAVRTAAAAPRRRALRRLRASRHAAAGTAAVAGTAAQMAAAPWAAAGSGGGRAAPAACEAGHAPGADRPAAPWAQAHTAWPPPQSLRHPGGHLPAQPEGASRHAHGVACAHDNRSCTTTHAGAQGAASCWYMHAQAYMRVQTLKLNINFLAPWTGASRCGRVKRMDKRKRASFALSSQDTVPKVRACMHARTYAHARKRAHTHTHEHTRSHRHSRGCAHVRKRTRAPPLVQTRPARPNLNGILPHLQGCAGRAPICRGRGAWAGRNRCTAVGRAAHRPVLRGLW